MIHSNELTQMLLDSGFPYSMDILHNMDKFQKLLAMEREQCAKRLDAVGCDHCAENIRLRGSND